MENLDDYVLVELKSDSGYIIMDKQGCCLLIDDTEEAQKTIHLLLENKVEIFDNADSNRIKYPRHVQPRQTYKRQGNVGYFNKKTFKIVNMY